jgi:hypothetical protein
VSFNFNNSGNNYTASYAGTEAIAPENTGIGWIAQSRLSNIVGRANQRLINAMRVDGVPLTIYTKTQTGFPCTCCRPTGSTAGLLSAIIDQVPTTNNYYTDPDSTRLPDPGEERYKVIRLKGVDLVDDISNPTWESLNSAKPSINTPEITENYNLNTVDINLNQNEDLDLIANNSSELEGEQAVGDIELDDFFAGGDSGAMFGGDKTACGICFTSGWTQGYSLLNGKRIVLDASGENPFSLQGADLNSGVFPFAFTLPVNNSGVFWKIELPVFCQSWINIRARNNLKPAPGVIIQYATDDNFNWQLLTLDILNSTSNYANRVWYIRAIRDPNFVNMPPVVFTHLELLVITSDNIPSQTPNFAYNTDFNQYDAIVNTQFDIAPSIVALPRESVFTDNKYGLFWKVVDVTAQMTSAQQVFGFTVTARLVQRHEMLYKLHELYTEVPNYLLTYPASGAELQNYNTTQVRQLNEIASTATNYQDLQQVQGGYAVVNEEEQKGGEQVDNIIPDDTQPLVYTQKEDIISIIPLEGNNGAILTEDLDGFIQDEITQ